MYTKIIVPLDGSAMAEAVLPYIEALAVGFRTVVELISVIDIGAMAAHLGGDRTPRLDALIAAEEKRTASYLENIARRFSGFPIERRIIRGHAAEAILEATNKERNILLAMATHGRSGADRWLLGSVAEKVLRGSTNPLFLVRAAVAKTTPQRIIDSIVVPLDGSPLAEEILPTVSSWAQALGLEVALIRAVDFPRHLGEAETFSGHDVLRQELHREATDYLKHKEAALVSEGVRTVSTLTLDGGAAEEIIAYAQTAPNALIAMSTHGRSGVRRWVLGSVTEKVVRHAIDPVLVVRGV
jgi:nucleotide-binding universal stress UspA family protein